MIELRSPTLRATFSPFGARLVSLFMGDTDVVAGGGSEEDFRKGDWTAGIVCGRMAGRITKSRFSLDGKNYPLVPSEGENQLHGGPVNFGNTNWDFELASNAITFRKNSPDGDQGYPGALDVEARYTLIDNTLSLDLGASTSKPTVVNLTNHAYWNLAGTGDGRAQIAEIDADSYIPLAEGKLPTGEIAIVEGTRFDFRKARAIAEPYDNAFVLNGERGRMKQAIRLSDAESGRAMEIHCTECCLQFYTADHWDQSMPGRSGPLRQFGAIALEPQNFPDAPTHANFPSAVLRPGETYLHRIEWRFFSS